jgi:hypothetical protein
MHCRCHLRLRIPIHMSSVHVRCAQTQPALLVRGRCHMRWYGLSRCTVRILDPRRGEPAGAKFFGVTSCYWIGRALWHLVDALLAQHRCEAVRKRRKSRSLNDETSWMQRRISVLRENLRLLDWPRSQRTIGKLKMLLF